MQKLQRSDCWESLSQRLLTVSVVACFVLNILGNFFLHYLIFNKESLGEVAASVSSMHLEA